MGSGAVLTLVTVIETVVWFDVQQVGPILFFGGLLTSLPFALLLLAGGYWLPRSQIPRSRYRQTVRWAVISGVAYGAFMIAIAVITYPDRPWGQIGVLRWGVSIGVGGGFLVGALNASSTQRAVQAERASIRAEEAQRQQELLEYLNAVLRHEVLNTANIIGGYADLIVEAMDEDTRNHEHATTIRRQTDRLTAIISDVRVLLTAAQGVDDFHTVDLVEVLTGEVKNLEDRYPAVETTVDLPESAVVEGDDLLPRLFSNLLENAVEHNPNDPPRVSVSGTVDAESVTVEIADNGPGIPPERRDSLFDRSREMGTDHGLGLTIVARLADRYDGSVELVETGSDGSRFAVTLPLA